MACHKQPITRWCEMSLWREFRQRRSIIGNLFCFLHTHPTGRTKDQNWPFPHTCADATFWFPLGSMNRYPGLLKHTNAVVTFIISLCMAPRTQENASLAVSLTRLSSPHASSSAAQTLLLPIGPFFRSQSLQRMLEGPLFCSDGPFP